jgi:hypothetical protein
VTGPRVTCRRSRGAWWWVTSIPALAALLALAACDPCSGIARCASSPYLAATGQIVDPATAQGVAGAGVAMRRTDGVGVEVESQSTHTDAEGFWRLEFAPASEGTLEVEAEVAPPGGAAYRIPGLQLVTKRSRGDANLNQRWVTAPYFYNFLEIFRRGTADERIENAQVQFRRTGGVMLTGPGVQTGVYRNVTDAGGRMPLFPSTGENAVLPTDGSAVIGDLTIDSPGLGRTIIQGMRLVPSYVYRDFPVIQRYDIAAGDVTRPP